MTQRTFTDPDGVRWMVWEVHPSLVERARLWERRRAPDRRRIVAPDPVVERRRGGDRRATTSRIRGGVFLPGFESGWLVFSRLDDRSPHHVRRLAPIPPGWTTVSERDLVELCRRAMPPVETSRVGR
jgi:hypothetical protein